MIIKLFRCIFESCVIYTDFDVHILQGDKREKNTTHNPYAIKFDCIVKCLDLIEPVRRCVWIEEIWIDGVTRPNNTLQEIAIFIFNEDIGSSTILVWFVVRFSRADGWILI